MKRKCVLFYFNVYKCLSGKYRIIKEHISSIMLGVLVLCILLPHLNLLHVVFHNVPQIRMRSCLLELFNHHWSDPERDRAH